MNAYRIVNTLQTAMKAGVGFNMNVLAQTQKPIGW
jgi:hypothetical protein